MDEFKILLKFFDKKANKLYIFYGTNLLFYRLLCKISCKYF